MKKQRFKRNAVLGILFFLPVLFLLFLYPSSHNYEPLNIVNENVKELNNFDSYTDNNIQLKDHITVLGFFGHQPKDHTIAALNLKELVYDKFKGFKKFQVVIVMPIGTEAEVKTLKTKVNNYEEVKFWHYVFGTPTQIKGLYESLKTNSNLSENLSTEDIFIVDKDLNQRGRIDDRTKRELESNKPYYSLFSYNCIDIDAIKNKMSEDMRILFTEYRQKRKGDFDSSQRRANDLNKNDEQ
ncbi:hypothetical protein ACFO5O_09230 [Geojedonia litorea]|uniref:Uncharacterized protein n=1 Tax=Geojedonia litorea TaxID=1268269 RepID=A0ABV9N6K4_9FLAO